MEQSAALPVAAQHPIEMLARDAQGLRRFPLGEPGFFEACVLPVTCHSSVYRIFYEIGQYLFSKILRCGGLGRR